MPTVEAVSECREAKESSSRRAEVVTSRHAPPSPARECGCSDCAVDLRRVPVSPIPSSLPIVPANDASEVEADELADEISPSPVRLQAKRSASGGGEGLAPASVHQVLGKAGVPLDSSVRSVMEPRFGADFSAVRIHRDPEAASSAAEVGARAYTVGNHIVFGERQYAPESRGGQRLIAHELTHTLQQGQGQVRLQRDVDPAALDQCIAEQGGDPRYRDGGLASPEELERYRAECTRRLEGTGVSRAIENLRIAWGYAQERLSAEVIHEIEGLFSARSLAMMAVFAAAYLAAQLTPVGWVADAFALFALTLTVVFVGALALEVARDLLTFFGAINATTDEERRTAGYALARAIARVGVGFVVALITRGIGRGVAGGGAPPSGSTAMVEVVATNGITVRVPVTATAVEAVQASRLQGLASYAVMVPPPGGTGPQAPASSASSGRGSGSGGGSREPGPGGSGEGPGRPGAAAAAGAARVRVPYGTGPLSQLAQQFRVALNLRRGGNIAVFEFERITPEFASIVRRLGGRNAQITGNRLTVQNVGGSAHSERLAHMLIQQAPANTLRVTKIYTEFNPCASSCSPLLRQHYPDAEVSFSFLWDWAREIPERNAAVDALFGP
ncbi:MAG: eCIS core domain-containing protein [Fimbriimonas sp.]